jgi:biofilm protein TabA
MKKSIFGKLIAVSMLCFAMISMASAQTKSGEWTKSSAKKWVNSRVWANGLAIVPHKTTDYVKFSTQYHKDKAMWEKIFKFMKENDLVNMPAGRYPIDGDRCFVNVTDAKTKSPDVVQIEAHKKYIDLQYMATNAELMGLISTANAKEIKPYNEKKDVVNYSGDKVKFYTLSGKTFFLLFPGELHKASIWTKGEETTGRKIVFKIAYIAD